MKQNIFSSTKNWTFSQADQEAQQKFKLLESQVRQSLPQSFYHRITHIQFLKKSPIYSLMQTIPKGVMHHNHYFCNDDEQFYVKYIISDSRFYLTKEMDKIEIGTKQIAKQNEWISMKQGKQRFGQSQWVSKVVGLTAFTQQQRQILNQDKKAIWKLFQLKIRCPLKIMFVRDIFQKYTRHTLLKYIRNGYDRLQIRNTIERLYQYDQEGNFILQHPQRVFVDCFETIIQQINKTYPHFTVGYITVGFKMLTDQQNYNIFKTSCQMNWDRIVGFDFVQEEDKYQSLQRYDQIIERIYQDFPNFKHMKKVYHAGETSNHLTNNIDLAVKAGSVRIGHGINILQRIEFLTHCKHVCFEKNPVSNLLLGYKSDLRQASAPILLGLGYPVSISPDDPGKFGLDDSTVDYIVAALCYNWTLRHLKLIAYHSINHAICEQSTRSQLIKDFNISWNKWVAGYLGINHTTIPVHKFRYQDIFTFNRSWSFSQIEEDKNNRYYRYRDEVLDSLPETIYQYGFMEHDGIIQNCKINELLRTMPKGVLHGCHLLYNHDQSFFLKYIVQSKHLQYLYYDEYLKCLTFSVPSQQNNNSLISLQTLKLQYQTEQQLASHLYSLYSMNRIELQSVAGNPNQFWKGCNKKKQKIKNLMTIKAIFRGYIQRIFQKLASFGYERVEFRLQPFNLIEYQQNGQIIKEFDFQELKNIIDSEYSKLKSKYPTFSIGIIILGNKSYDYQQNWKIFNSICQLKWQKVIGFDFQQDIEDNYPSLQTYDTIIDNILIQYDNRPYQKYYEAGNTTNHANSNIQTAIKGGVKRIANGYNILQQIDLLSYCKDICFEINPILNLVEGSSKRNDFRLSVAPILLGLGFPISINSDMSGLIGYESNLYDLYIAAISYNWSLKHFKLTILHSIHYSGVTEGMKKTMLNNFKAKWDKWIAQIQL